MFTFEQIINKIFSFWELLLHHNQFEDDVAFFNVGGDSKTVVELMMLLDEEFGVNIQTADIFVNSTIVSLSRYIARKLGVDVTDHTSVQLAKPMREPMMTGEEEIRSDIAVIGIGCKLPDSETPWQFWRNMCEGKSAISSAAKTGRGLGKDLRSGFVSDTHRFDAPFFHISAKEAGSLDPQQKIMLECAWNALEDAGYAGAAISNSKTGVFIGATMGDYLSMDRDEELNGTLMALIANRISYFFNLSGPSQVIDTACSSSLVAIHQACQSIQLKESDLAIVGGVNLILSDRRYRTMGKKSMLSPDGLCYTFDERANGFVPGEGAVAIVLKPLHKALEDGDGIHAVIKGSATNNDGRTNGINAPNPEAQTAVIKAAWDRAGVSIETSSYFEAHGTGTALGDPIEVSALAAAFPNTAKKNSYPLGSVKTHIGHLEWAAGLAGVLKVILSMKHKKLPPHLNYSRPNLKIDFENSPFYIQTNLTPWEPPPNGVLRAGVSSFGAGGTNCHIVVEEAPPLAMGNSGISHYVLNLSARSKSALLERVKQMYDRLKETNDWIVGEVCRSTNIGRGDFVHRLSYVVANKTDLLEQLKETIHQGLGDAGSKGFYKEVKRSKRPKTVFSFTGQGAQYPGMGGELYRTLPVFKKHMDECAATMDQYLDIPLLELLYGSEDERLQETRYTQPVTFAVEYALARTWMELGIQPDIMIGHSVGEYAAACIGGGLLLEDASRMIVMRARFMQERCQRGKMAAVFASAVQIEEELKECWSSVSIAAINGERQIVVSGESERIEQLTAAWRARGIRIVELQVSHAFHSPMMEPMLGEYGRELQNIPFGELQIPIVSNVTGKLIERMDALYWLEQITKPVLYAAGIEQIQAEQCNVILEVGPSSTLTAMTKQAMGNGEYLLVHSLQNGQDDWHCISNALSKMYLHGVTVPIERISGQYGKRILLPTYPFEKNDLRGDQPVHTANSIGPGVTFESSTLVRSEDRMHDSVEYYSKEWERISEPHLDVGGSLKSTYVLFIDNEHRSYLEQIAMLLEEKGNRIIRIFRQPSDNGLYAEESSKGCQDLKHDLRGMLPKGTSLKVIYSWNTPQGLLYFLQTFGFSIDLRIEECLIVTSKAQFVKDDALIYPEHALLWGMVQAAKTEYSSIAFRLLDIDWEEDADKRDIEAIGRVLSSVDWTQLAYRKGEFFRQNWSELGNKAKQIESDLIKPGGVYVVSGGLGAIGLELAHYFARKYRAKLVLLHRREFPDRVLWHDWQDRNPDSDEIMMTITKLQELIKLGSDILLLRGDITDRWFLRDAIRTTKERFHIIDGVIHAAGDLRDGLIHNKDIIDFQYVIQSKVNGTIVLDQETREEQLDFFLMFSSVVSVFGSTGQADYAAANAFLDSYAFQRQLETGQKTRVINWGTWKIGMASAESIQKKSEEQGVLPLDTESALLALVRSLELSETQIMIGRLSEEKKRSLLASGQSTEVLMENNRTTTASLDPVKVHSSTQLVRGIIADILEQQAESIDIDTNFFELGLNSIDLLRLISELNESLDAELPSTLFFDYPTIEKLSLHIAGVKRKTVVEKVRARDSDNLPLHRQSAENTHSGNDIAVIGMALRFPGANSPEQFWENIIKNKAFIREIPADRFPLESYYDPNPSAPDKSYSKWAGLIQDIDQFDPLFFKISPREAEAMDPQQRILLELAYELFERAGYPDSSEMRSNTGVFIGCEPEEYIGERGIDAHTAMGGANSSCMNANRVSYVYHLTGPSLTIDTACSSSAVAIHMACQSLLTEECEMAVGGGIKLLVGPRGFVVNSKAKMLSPTGKCSTFDNAADGYVRGEGGGLVLLKPLHTAIRDNDTIHAVIKATAINHDGGDKAGLTVPNQKSHQELFTKAWKKVNIDPRTISFIEAHGTGTKLGDPIEFDGLTQAFRKFSSDVGFCSIGSIKPSIGHLESASGVAGLIKAVLALRYKMIPGTIGIKNINQKIDVENSPFRIPTEAEPWDTYIGERRRAGVSSFGFGGSNAHIVLEEAPAVERADQTVKPYPIVLTAKTEMALKLKVTDLQNVLRSQKHARLSDLSYTLAAGRDIFAHRISFSSHTVSEMRNKLALISLSPETLLENDIYVGECKDSKMSVLPAVKVKFSRQSLTYSREDWNAFMAYGAFREAVREIHQALQTYAPANGYTVQHDRITDDVAVKYALAKLLYSCGLELVGSDAYSKRIIDMLGGSLSPEQAVQNIIADAEGLPGGQEMPTEVWSPSDESNDPGITLFIGDHEGYFSLPNMGCLTNGNFMNTLLFMFARGYKIRFNLFYQEGDARKMELPTYPFQRNSYWRVAALQEKAGASASTATTGTENKFSFYQNVWSEEAVRRNPETSVRKCFLFTAGGTQLPERVRSVLEIQTVTVTMGPQFGVVSSSEMTINPNSPDDYKRLLHLHPDVSHIMFLWDFLYEEMYDWSEYKKQLQEGYYSLFQLGQALSDKSMTEGNQIALITVTRMGQPNTGVNDLNPFAAPLINMTVNMPFELHHIRSKTIDLDASRDTLQCFLESLTAEVNDFSTSEIVYRDGRRLSKEIKLLDPMAISRDRMKEEGVYVITGGFGGIGKKVAVHLAEMGARKLVLLGRNADQNSPVMRKLERMGVEALAVKADITEYEAMEHATATIRARFGGIHGIIHAAGVFENTERSLRMKQRSTVERVLEAKVKGTWILQQVTRNDPLQFFLMFSSVSVMNGTLASGQLDYAAANSFLDPSAERLRAKGIYAVSIQWPQWDGLGMAEGKTVSDAMTRLGFASLSAEEGLRLFDSVLQGDAPPVVAVLPHEWLKRQESLLRFNRTTKPCSTSSTKHSAKYESPSTSLGGSGDSSNKLRASKGERVISSILCRYLGLRSDELDTSADFDDYGIDSLLLADLTGALEREYGVNFDPSLFLLYPTVDSLAAYLDASIHDSSFESNVLDELIEKKPPVSTDESVEDQSGTQQQCSIDSLVSRLISHDISVRDAVDFLKEWQGGCIS